MGVKQIVTTDFAQVANSGEEASRKGPLLRNLADVKVEVVGRARTLPSPESGIRTAALQMQILDLESQLAALSEAVAQEKAKSSALHGSAARIAALEAELVAASNARDAAGSVAVAAVAELRELRNARDALLQEREAAYSERDVARAAAKAAEARIVELEAKLNGLLVACAGAASGPEVRQGDSTAS